MSVVLGYGGLANTNGARDFSGKDEFIPPDFSGVNLLKRSGSPYRYLMHALAGLLLVPLESLRRLLQ